MGKAREPEPVKLVVSMFTADQELFAPVQARLEQMFGPIDFRSELFPFTHTDYYTEEFGTGLVRQFCTFERLIRPDWLPEIKISTNGLEEEYAIAGKRRINIDPGYVSLSKLVLATTKDHAHRVYVGRGIYAEVTLRYQQKAFQPWPWTYPDYASPPYLRLFEEIRRRYRMQLRTEEQAS